MNEAKQYPRSRWLVLITAIDIAGKIVSHSGKIILKISAACFESLRLPELFERCKYVPAIV